jgi:hypothetical protein
MPDNAVARIQLDPRGSTALSGASVPRSCTAPLLGAKIIALAMGLLDDLHELQRRYENADRHEREALVLAISVLEKSRQSRIASRDQRIAIEDPGPVEADTANIAAAQEIAASKG